MFHNSTHQGDGKSVAAKGENAAQKYHGLGRAAFTIGQIKMIARKINLPLLTRSISIVIDILVMFTVIGQIFFELCILVSIRILGNIFFPK